MTTGIVVRDHEGRIKDAWTYYSLSPNAFGAKVKEVLHALQKAHEMNLLTVIVEGDSLEVSKALNGIAAQVDWRSQSIVDDALSILQQHSSWTAKHTSRNCNKMAHLLAHWASESQIFGRIPMEKIPSCIFLADALDNPPGCTLPIDVNN